MINLSDLEFVNSFKLCLVKSRNVIKIIHFTTERTNTYFCHGDGYLGVVCVEQFCDLKHSAREHTTVGMETRAFTCKIHCHLTLSSLKQNHPKSD